MRKKDTHVDLDAELDLDQMLSQFNTAITANKILDKANSTGLSLKDLSVVVESGKQKCVTKDEKNRSKSIRRKQLIEKMRKRMIRGECSLAKDIANRIRRCQELIQVWDLLETLSDKDIVTLRRNLESINNRASSLVKDVRVLEGAIERKKQEDSVIKQVEEANSALLKAVHEKDYEQVKVLKAFCKKHMKTYNLRKKRLRPYLEKAREARLKFLAEKRKLMHIQFEMYSQFTEICADDVSNGYLKNLEESGQAQIVKCIESFRRLRTSNKDHVNELDKPLGQVAMSFLADVEAEMDKIDEMCLFKMDDIIDEVIVLVRKSRLSEEGKGKELAKEKSQRMVYQEKQGKQASS